jgi:hypothetical protein
METVMNIKKLLLVSLISLNISGVVYGAAAAAEESNAVSTMDLSDKIIIPKTLFCKSEVFQDMLRNTGLEDSEEHRTFEPKVLPTLSNPDLAKTFNNVEKYLNPSVVFNITSISNEDLLDILEAIIAYDIKKGEDELSHYQIPFLTEIIIRNDALLYPQLSINKKLSIHKEMWTLTVKQLVIDRFNQDPNQDRRQALRDSYESFQMNIDPDHLVISKAIGIDKELVGFSIRELHEMGISFDGDRFGILDLSNLHINNLDGSDLVPNTIRSLHLDSNSITTLQPGVFNGLTQLDELNLNHNSITTLQPGAFNDLINLTGLILDNNNIETLQPGAFNGLTQLEELNLENNRITTLQPGAFNGLTNLAELDL